MLHAGGGGCACQHWGARCTAWGPSRALGLQACEAADEGQGPEKRGSARAPLHCHAPRAAQAGSQQRGPRQTCERRACPGGGFWSTFRLLSPAFPRTLESQRWRDLPSAGSLSRWPQWPELCRQGQELAALGLPHGTGARALGSSSTAFQSAGRWSRSGAAGTPTGIHTVPGAAGQGFNLLHHSAGFLQPGDLARGRWGQCGPGPPKQGDPLVPSRARAPGPPPGRVPAQGMVSPPLQGLLTPAQGRPQAVTSDPQVCCSGGRPTALA